MKDIEQKTAVARWNLVFALWLVPVWLSAAGRVLPASYFRDLTQRFKESVELLIRNEKLLTG